MPYPQKFLVVLCLPFVHLLYEFGLCVCPLDVKKLSHKLGVSLNVVVGRSLLISGNATFTLAAPFDNLEKCTRKINWM